MYRCGTRFRFNCDIVIHDQNVRNVTLLFYAIDFNHATGKSASTANIFILYDVDVFAAQCRNIQSVGIVRNENFQLAM